MVFAELPLDRAVEGLTLLGNRQTFGTVVINPGGQPVESTPR